MRKERGCECRALRGKLSLQKGGFRSREQDHNKKICIEIFRKNQKKVSRCEKSNVFVTNTLLSKPVTSYLL